MKSSYFITASAVILPLVALICLIGHRPAVITVWDVAKSPSAWNGKEIKVRGYCEFDGGGYESQEFLAATEFESKKQDLGIRIRIRTVKNRALSGSWDKPFRATLTITGTYHLENSVMHPYGVLDDITETLFETPEPETLQPDPGRK